MITIVINALSALQGGGQTYLINLLQQFEEKHSKQYEDVKLVVIAPKILDDLFSSSEIKVLRPDFPSKGIFHRYLWERFRLPGLLKDLDAQVLYCPGGMVSVGRITNCKIAVAFRNMLPFDDVEQKRYSIGYMRLRLWLLRFFQLRSFRNADMVIFISHYAKDVIDRILPVRKGRSVVIQHGIPLQFYRDEKRSESPLPYEYVLYVSYIDVYKHQVEVIRAWKQMMEVRRTHEKLVLIGHASAPYLLKVHETIRDLGLEDDVIYPGSVKYDSLPYYYQFAKLNIFASTCENCPNILLEAIASGKPLFCSKHMPMPEFGGDAVVYFDPSKPEELANLLIRHIDDAEFLKNMGKAAYERSRLFDSKASVEKTWTALLELID